jgi:hypothetical protein
MKKPAMEDRRKMNMKTKGEGGGQQRKEEKWID